jgi:hypothetical protein
VYNTLGALKGPSPPSAVKADEASPEIVVTAPELSKLDALQMLLDVIGLIPGLGAPADIVNAIISGARGDWLGAGLSLVGVVPVAGEAATAGKIAKNADRYAAAVAKVADEVLPHLPARVQDKLRPAIDAARKKIDELGGKAPKKEPQAPPKAKQEGADGQKVKPRPKTKVKCFCVQDRAKGGRDEYERQLKKQQDGLNGMTADQYLAERRAFTGKDPCGGYAPTVAGKTKRRDPAVTRKAKGDRARKQAERYSEEFRTRGMSRADAKRLGGAKAERERRNLDALHNQDMVAGGDDVIGSLNAQGHRVAGDADFGFGDTNRHIGTQWNGERIKSIDAEACKMSQGGKGDEKMNLQLRPCGKHEAGAAGCKQKGRR